MKGLVFASLLMAAPLAAFSTAPAAAQNWNLEVEETATGYRVGDPEAPLQLIEFVSYTCSHCADFERDAEAELRYFYVHEGHAALEVRPFIRNPIDVAATLAAQCGDDSKFFGNHSAILHAQDNWLPIAQEISAAQQARWNSGAVSSRMRAIASDLDFYELMERRGYSMSQLDVCLSDETRARAITDASATNIAEFNVPGTPSFALNGTLLDGVHSWPALQQALSAARSAPVSSAE